VARFSVDTNILFYAIDRRSPDKAGRARAALERLMTGDSLLTQQVLGEFLNLTRKLPVADHDRLVAFAKDMSSYLGVAPTRPELLFRAHDLAREAQLQFWDALIILVCAGHGVTHLLSEDLQHGQVISGVTILNPFLPEAVEVIAALAREQR
jgi:predicted nucleic acid-binding protein